ncbi:MAG: TraR/DksA C4-type zinc finger protein [bacterium]|nr:TraR/DksA C4-type zinc finger protein [bacterium]
MARKQPTGKGKARPAARAARKTAAAGKARRRPPALPRAELKKFKELLLVHKDRLMGNFMSLRQTHLRSSQREATGDLSGYSLHMADIGTDTYDREFGLAVASTEQDTLYRIDEALKRIEERTYGICEGCEKPIKAARLKAVPWEPLCIKCKEALESGEGES